MICYNCKKVEGCPAFQTLYNMSKDFCINDCQNYDEIPKDKYKKIAENDDFMHLIYDYFTEQVKGGYSNEEVVEVIKRVMYSL